MTSQKIVPIVGTVGVPARYGGFETLAEQLCRHVSPDQVRFLVDLLNTPSVRLVNLTGPAGVGKTSLARAVLQQIPAEVPTLSVSFASLEDASLLAVRLAKALDIAPVGAESWESRVINHLRSKHMVLLLDKYSPIPFYHH